MAGVQKYFREWTLPHIWCPGCGHGTVTGGVVRAIDRVGWDQDRTVIVSGIGCSGRAPGYLDFNTLHTTHGRALAFATGVKMARPGLNVVVLTGDGDAAAIGGNHLIHAARRNIDITAVCYNNSIYGMTGGQYSPLTPPEHFASTAPYGNIDPSFDLCKLMVGAGASYVARSTVYHIAQLINYITAGLQKRGFAFIEAVTQCPVVYGRRNRMGSAIDLLKWQRDSAVPIQRAEKMDAGELAGKTIIGEFADLDAPEYTESYQRILERVRERGEGQ